MKWVSPQKQSILQTFNMLLLVSALSACGGGGGDENPSSPLPSAAEQELRAALDDVVSDVDFTLMIETEAGEQFIYSRGASNELVSYESASTSKMVTAAVILSLVDDGILSLDDSPQDYLSFWPTTGNHADIQLRHLLSFTSGLTDQPPCVNLSNADFDTCVESILNQNPTIPTPGSEFYYASTHMQVAGLMAIRAAGITDWTTLFNNFKADKNIFSNASYDLPSATNPRLAGGMHWQATEYVEFLSLLYHKQLLSPATTGEMLSDQIEAATIVSSPVEVNGLGISWHYGFGLWVECLQQPLDCANATRFSSAGAYGAYPFMDFEYNYFGIVARQGNLGTGSEGYQIYREVAPLIEIWVAENN